jgi:catechol 2,3-dioxygenase-like lactoylglutathione lyase family enzyme
MIDHVDILVADVSESARFFEAALAPLGYKRHVAANPSGFGVDPIAPDFWIRAGGPSRPLPHVAFNCVTRELVHRCHEAALKAGARNQRAPALMPQVHAAYFSGQVLDPDGHNIEFACHRAE